MDVPSIRPPARSEAQLDLEIHALTHEVNALAGRVDITMRLIARIIAKMDPGFLNDPFDPEVQRKSDLIGEQIIAKLKVEALSQASHDPIVFDRLKRYFKDLT